MLTDDRICINILGTFAADFAEKSTLRHHSLRFTSIVLAHNNNNNNNKKKKKKKKKKKNCGDSCTLIVSDLRAIIRFISHKNKKFLSGYPPR